MNFTTPHGQKFTKLLMKMNGYSSHPLKDFDTFLTLASCCLRQAAHKLRTGVQSEEIEKLYMDTVKTVKNPSVASEMFAELSLGLTVAHDFLGEVYMINELGNKNSGQFFTPYCISQVMSRCTLADFKFKKGERTTMNDPACGSGSTLISAVEIMKEKGIRQDEIYIVGQDIDLRCCKMIYVQMSILDIPGRVDHMNTVSLEHWDSWETIGYLRNPFPRPDFTRQTTTEELLSELF